MKKTRRKRRTHRRTSRKEVKNGRRKRQENLYRANGQYGTTEDRWDNCQAICGTISYPDDGARGRADQEEKAVVVRPTILV